jgi:hypothetical protein
VAANVSTVESIAATPIPNRRIVSFTFVAQQRAL